MAIRAADPVCGGRLEAVGAAARPIRPRISPDRSFAGPGCRWPGVQGYFRARLGESVAGESVTHALPGAARETWLATETPMTEFQDKVYVVTGASSGMGLATAVELARGGACIVGAARRPDRGEEMLAQVRAVGGKGEFVRTDISDPVAIEGLFHHVMGTHGRLDGAFNNAAMEIDPGYLADVPLASFDELFAVNVRGTFVCMQYEMRIMRQQKRGAIVNTASVGGVAGLRHGSVYAASKHAVVGMTKSAALDAAEFGVRVNAICPGSIETEMMQRWARGDPEIVKRFASYSPLKRVGSPREIADAVLWLLSDRSSYVTGVAVGVDGGTTAGVMM